MKIHQPSSARTLKTAPAGLMKFDPTHAMLIQAENIKNEKKF